MNPIYLDNAATTQLEPSLIEFITKANTDFFANPSSIHSQGQKSRQALEAARKTIADSLEVNASEIYFTSGATEANNIVFENTNYDLVITSPIEHNCIIESCKKHQANTHWLSVDKHGYIDLTELEQVLKANADKKALVSIAHVNNELGTIQDIAKISKLCQEYSALFHSDIVQSFGKLQLDLSKIHMDFASASAHKLHGPKGVGFLYRNQVSTARYQKFYGFIVGGGQEQELRSGTENLISILAFAELVKNMNTKCKLTKNLDQELLEQLQRLKGIHFNSPLERRAGLFNIALPNSKFDKDQLLLQMDLRGFCVSTGSACSSNKLSSEEAQLNSSYVLRACGITEELASKSIRISLSKFNTEEDLQALVHCLEQLV